MAKSTDDIMTRIEEKTKSAGITGYEYNGNGDKKPYTCKFL